MGDGLGTLLSISKDKCEPSQTFGVFICNNMNKILYLEKKSIVLFCSCVIIFNEIENILYQQVMYIFFHIYPPISKLRCHLQFKIVA